MRKTCWQYDIKQKIKAKEGDQVPFKDETNYLIKEITYREAKDFIIKYEWLKNIGSSKYCYGMFIDKCLAGVVCFSDPVAPKSYSKLLDINEGEILQLSRGASSHWAPKWVGSKLISESLKRIQKKLNIKIVVAYADPKAGEIGTIYQASNAYYIGYTNPGGAKKYKIKGTVYHPRKLHKKFGTRNIGFLKKLDPKLQIIKIHPKHRYIFILQNGTNRKRFLERIEHLIQPYPKRVKSVNTFLS